MATVTWNVKHNQNLIDYLDFLIEKIICVEYEDGMEINKKCFMKFKNKKCGHFENNENQPHQKTYLKAIIRNGKPNIVKNKNIHMLFGTFVDYMIRKILEEMGDGLKIIKKKRLIAERSLGMMQGNFSENNVWKMVKDEEFDYEEILKNMNEGVPLFFDEDFDGEVSRVFMKKDNIIYYNEENVGAFIDDPNLDDYVELENWIYNYNNSKTWKNIIEDTFYMSQSDQLYRRGVLSQIVNLNKKDVKDFEAFLSNLIDLLNSIKFKKSILLNPTLGNNYVNADADIIDEEGIYDIKTSNYNPKKEDIRQLLVYSALNYEQNDTFLKKLVIINPVLLRLFHFDISMIKKENLTEILNILKSS